MPKNININNFKKKKKEAHFKQSQGIFKRPYMVHYITFVLMIIVSH